MQNLLNSERWVVTGLLWAAMAFSVGLLFEWFDGATFTADDLALRAGLWVAGGLTFGQAMRFISRRSALGAR